MEFEHVGSHCSLSTCKQKDFLPFTCDSCHQQFCLSHRSYDSHGCDGGLKKDMTSLDCPICGKSVKFDKAKDPNEVWEDHYSFFCAKQSTTASHIIHCARHGCSSHLGPSNTFQCPKCQKKVCLSHRMSDEHDCVQTTRKPAPTQVKRSIANSSSTAPAKSVAVPPPPTSSSNPREAFLQRVEAKSTSSGKRPNNNSSQPKPSTIRKDPPPAKPSTNSRSSSRESFLCPMCGVDCNNLNNLSRHVENHLMNESTTSTPPQPVPSPSNTSSAEVRA